MPTDDRDPITARVIGAAMEVHKQLGPGLLERLYLRALTTELTIQGMRPVTEVLIPVRYKGVDIGGSLRVDLLISGRVVVEVKAVKSLEPVHEAQLLTYLRLTGIKTGLLINFNVARLIDGVKRRRC